MPVDYVMSALYTVGDPEIYDPIIARSGRITKTGREEGYPGGIVFTSLEEAIKNRGSYDIYVLVTDLSNTYLLEGTRHLIRSADIVTKYIP